jgi:hypothetical protein
MHAAWGRRRHRLDVDPVTAPHVRWIFERRQEGMSMAAIARSLNERGVASPGAYDKERNRHRVGSVWTLRTVAAILGNPRYTGRQVWNRQFTDHRETVPGDRRSSHGPARIWNPRIDWVIYEELTHPPLVSDDDFLTVQQVTALERPEDGQARRYPFRGLLVCAVCGRRLESHWVNRRAGYRCRHGRTSAHPLDADEPRWVYWSQARLTEALAGLAQLSDADSAAAHLRARDAVIVCGARTIVIEGAVPDEAGAVESEQEIGTVQLELPLSSPEGRLPGRKNLRKPKSRSRGRRRKGKTPNQDPRPKT